MWSRHFTCSLSKHCLVFGQPFVKRFALCYRTVVCPVLSVCLSCLWRWCSVAKQLDGSRWDWHGGTLGPGHSVLDGDPDAPQNVHSCLQFSAHVCCGQTVGWIKMRLARRYPRPRPHCVKWGPSSFPKRGTAAPNFRPMSVVVQKQLVRWKINQFSMPNFK